MRRLGLATEQDVVAVLSSRARVRRDHLGARVGARRARVCGNRWGGTEERQRGRLTYWADGFLSETSTKLERSRWSGNEIFSCRQRRQEGSGGAERRHGRHQIGSCRTRRQGERLAPTATQRGRSSGREASMRGGAGRFGRGGVGRGDQRFATCGSTALVSPCDGTGRGRGPSGGKDHLGAFGPAQSTRQTPARRRGLRRRNH